MGVRELIWALIAVLAAYGLWQLYRARRAAKSARAGAGTSAPAPGKAAAGTPPAGEDEENDGDFEAYAPAPRSPAVAGQASADAFQMEFELQQLRRQVAMLDAEQQAQRQALTALTDELRALRERFDVSQTVQGVSPEYDEALVFARRGLDAEAIAERCGISVAEAQLVLSLARGGPAGGREAK